MQETLGSESPFTTDFRGCASSSCALEILTVSSSSQLIFKDFNVFYKCQFNLCVKDKKNSAIKGNAAVRTDSLRNEAEGQN